MGVRRIAAAAGLVVVLVAGVGAGASVARTQPPCWAKSTAAGVCRTQTGTTTTASSSETTTTATATIALATSATNNKTTSSTATTTTSNSSTTAASALTFDSATAGLDGAPPSLANATVVTTPAGFSTAIANARAGDVIDVKGSMEMPGEFTGFNRIISGGTVDVVFEPGAGFTGTAGQNLPAVWLKSSGGWRLWGGSITTGPTGGNGVLVYATPGPFTWTGFTVHNTGNSGVAVYPVGGNIDRLTLKGLVEDAGQDLSYDPHAEKGTGLHGWNLADATGGLVENSTFACDVENQPTGAAVEVDMGQIGPSVTLYARAGHLGFPLPGTSWSGDAQSQVAGNVVQMWGASPSGALDVRYAEGTDIQGRIVETNGAYGGATYAQSTVDYGVATGPILQNPLLSRVAYTTGATRLNLGAVSPLP